MHNPQISYNHKQSLQCIPQMSYNNNQLVQRNKQIIDNPNQRPHKNYQMVKFNNGPLYNQNNNQYVRNVSLQRTAQ